MLTLPDQNLVGQFFIFGRMHGLEGTYWDIMRFIELFQQST